ncbi:MAG: hypothetical protein QOI54_1867 [Actinomycetota bacterium]|nr:hypothetical protein [Actinomycetota bacterium]
MEELALRAGVHRTSIGLIERGRRGLTLEVAARLTAAVGIRLGDVINEALGPARDS